MVNLFPLNDYNRMKSKFQTIWRPKIFERDGWKCRVCGVKPDTPYLDLAHITPNRDFVTVRNRLEDMEYSYREDNLMAFCRECHQLQHGETEWKWDGPDTKKLVSRKVGYLWPKPKVKELFYMLQKGNVIVAEIGVHQTARLLELLEDPDCREFLELSAKIDEREKGALKEADRRRDIIDQLFREVLNQRGWVSAEELVPKGAPPVTVPGTGPLDDRWATAGWLPVTKCAHPGDEAALERYLHEQCVLGPASCDGDISWCKHCRITYCAYHGPRHRVHAN